jgi:hypothetical protein
VNAGGAVSATGLSGPTGVFEYNGKVIITDGGNNRVLIWNSIPTSNGAPADIVLGQPDMSQSANNNGGSVMNNFNQPITSAVINDKLFVVDCNTAHVLIWNQVPTRTLQPADIILGSTSPGTSSTQFDCPHQVASDGKNWFYLT